MESRPCIFIPEGVFEDAALVTFLDMKCSLGVHHGWEAAIGPLVVTKSEGNLIKELNWRNAFDVYKEAVEADIGKELDESNFYEISSHYPFGIYMEGGESLVREVLKKNSKGNLLCASDVPENAVINILKGEKYSLVKSAGEDLQEKHWMIVSLTTITVLSTVCSWIV